MPLPAHSCTTSTGLISVPREAACLCLRWLHFRASAAYIHAPHTTLASCASVNVHVEPALPCLVCLHPHACRKAPLQHYHVTSQTWCLHFCALRPCTHVPHVSLAETLTCPVVPYPRDFTTVVPSFLCLHVPAPTCLTCHSPRLLRAP